jgi:fibronectin-binding autotransporter adhesin
MIAHPSSTRCRAYNLSVLCVIGLLALGSIPAAAQNIGDWQTVPSLTWGIWDNSNPNVNDDDSTWQTYTGTETGWETETGKTNAVNFPNNTTTNVITILAGTTITNTETTAITADGLIVAGGGCLQFYKSTFTLEHNPSPNYTYDLDIFGAVGISNNSSSLFALDAGATIFVEDGGTITNYGGSSADVFSGAGYTTGAVTFSTGSLFVLSGTKATAVPLATWNPGSTFEFAPTASAALGFTTGFSFSSQFVNQTYGNFIWNWPLQPGKAGSAADNGGNVTIDGNFYIAAANGQVVEDLPYYGYTLTVVSNFGITNVVYYPTASGPGTATLIVGGNFIVDSTATIGINNSSALGAVIFNGNSASPQTLGIYGSNSSAGSWNWTVNSGAMVNLDSTLEVNSGVSGTGGFLTVNGALNLTANGSITGSSNTITVAQNATLNVSQAASGLALGAEESLVGAGTITGNVGAGSTSVIHPSLGLPLTFDGNLTYGSVTSTNIFNLTGSTSGTNDQIVVNGGTLNGNNAQIVINPVSGTLATSDYVLFNVTGGGTISHFFTGPAWLGTPPANSNSYSIVTNGTQILLHYAVATAPRPDITGISLSGTNLLINGTNGVAGNYIVLMNTNLLTTNWIPVATNALTGSGSFSFTATNAVKPSSSQQFYILQAP